MDYPASFLYDPADHYYQNLARKKLGDDRNAEKAFQDLLAESLKKLEEGIQLGYFNIYVANLSLFQNDLQKLNQERCYFNIGLANLGLGNNVEAKIAFEKVLGLNPNHVAAKEELSHLR